MADDKRTDIFVRGPNPEKAEAQDILHAHRMPLNAFFRACLRALIADPDGFLRYLERHQSAPRRRGRPRKPRD